VCPPPTSRKANTYLLHLRPAGSDLTATTYTHTFLPNSSSPLPVILADYVKADSGTGLVHTAPSHGMEDYGSYRAYLSSLPVPPSDDRKWLPNQVDDSGRFSDEILGLVSSEEQGRRLLGKSVLEEGSREVIEILRSEGGLFKELDIVHKYAHDWRTKKPIIVR
jgi:isoleucyl-tRNA synthetase